jgi:hypothetical protein
MKRLLEPEWLDDLPPSDPQAIGSRRDLQRLNFWMGHARIFRKIWLQAFGQNPPQRIIELGAGDGTLLLKLAEALSSHWPKLEVILVDRRPAIAPETLAGFKRLGWRVEVVAADVFEWLPRQARCSGMMANLFLHHFSPEQLDCLLKIISERCDVFMACEPRRATPALITTRLLWMLGCNAVTRHDAVISVRAGFQNRELSAQWPIQGWDLREEAAGAFSHLFVARRLIS